MQFHHFSKKRGGMSGVTETRGLLFGRNLGVVKTMANGSDPCASAPHQSKHLALAAGLAPGEPGGCWEAQSLQSGILFKYRKKPPSFTPSEHWREKWCGNPGIAGGVTFISVENEIVWMFFPPLCRSLFLIFK